MSAMSDLRYHDAVQAIKAAILQSQYDAARSVNEKQLLLYYGIGKYIAQKSRKESWGQGAIEAISSQLQAELPGLRGFSTRNLRYMRVFYTEWRCLDGGPEDGENGESGDSALASAEIAGPPSSEILHLQMPNLRDFPLREFLGISFTHHRVIIEKVKAAEERFFYIRRCFSQKYTIGELQRSISQDDFHHQGSLPNNFLRTLPTPKQALQAISVFKDEYLLDFINVEELGVRDWQDVDERVMENAIIHNVKNFILAFGRDFAFIRNQYHLDAFGEDQYIDLLFFNRALNCLVAVELKTGKFKTAYLGHLQGYLSILDACERKPHENPAIGLILCKDVNRSFADYVIRDYTKPMGVAAYKTSRDMSEDLRKALPDIEDLRRLLDANEET